MAKSSTTPKGSRNPKVQASEAPGVTASREGNRPVHTVRYRGCEAAVWKNSSDKGDSYTVTLRKSWRDEKKVWHDSPTFLSSDLPTLMKAVADAHSWIAWQERKRKTGAASGGGQ